MTIRDRFVEAAKNYIGTGCTIFNNYFGMPAGTPWCAEFVSKCASDVGAIDKCFIKSAGAGDIPRYGVAKGYGKWFEGHKSVPQSGDAILFTWNGLGYYPNHDAYFSDHIGIVEYVEGNTVHTIEGNANGTNTSSTVCRKSYPLYSGKINGYYRPNWQLADSSYDNNQDSTQTITSSDIAEVQKWHNVNYGTVCDIDGEYGPQTKSAIVGSLQCYLNANYNAKLTVDGIMGRLTGSACPLLREGDTSEYVRILQSALICHGYDTGGYDGEFGTKTKQAVIDFQIKNNLEVDGIVGPETFYALLK